MNWIVVLITIVIAFNACNKLGVIPDPPATDDTPIPSPVGTPVGAPSTKNIGISGGTVVSTDKKIELDIPAGAISANTDITIQAITNTAPNGVSNAYQLSPDGIKFLKPITLKIHYTDDELASTLSDLMGIAFQDNTGVWYRLKNITNNVASKIISASIAHFSSWTLFDVYMLNPASANVKVNETVPLEVSYVVPSNDDDELSPLFPKNATIIWSVNGVTNGNSSVGTLTNNNTRSVYKAPSKAPAQNPVAVSAQIQLNIKYQGKTINKASLVSNILVGGQEYLLEIVFKQDALQRGLWVTDSASMDVGISGNSVLVSNIKNFKPTASPGTVNVAPCTFSYVPDNIGHINITEATGELRVQSPTMTSIQFFFKHTNTSTSNFRQYCDNVTPPYDVTGGGYKNDGTPLTLFFDLTDKVVYDSAPPSPYQIFNAKLTLIK